MKKENSALSMIELLVAIAVLGGALLPIWHLQHQSARRVNMGKNQTLIKNISFAFATQVRKCDPGLLPATQGYRKIEINDQGLYHLGGPSSINNIALPDWEVETMVLNYKIKKMTSIPRDNCLVMLKISWVRRDTGAVEFLVPTLVSHD